MQTLDNAQVSETSPEFRDLAARIASSQALAKSARLRELFLYLFEHTISGDSQALREQNIGEEVFSRSRGYDTGADNIVRVSVFQLRKKLDQYFSSEGREEPWVITIPKGHYRVEFHPKSSPSTRDPASPLTRSALASPQHWPSRSWLLAAVSLAILLFAGWLLFRSAAALPPSSAPVQLSRFWKTIFDLNRNAYVVVADIGFSLYQDVYGLSQGLDEYLARFPPDKVAGAYPPELTLRLLDRQYTSLSDASIAFRLGAINQSIGGTATIRSARSFDIRDFKAHNVVLIGSARSNPWVSLLKGRNFRIEYESSPPRGFIRNSSPRPGEQAVLRATAIAGKPGEAYGLIAFLPNLDDSGFIVSIAGTNMEGTEAAADLLLNERQFSMLLNRLGVSGQSPIPFFEAVIRASSIGGAGSASEIVAFRFRQRSH